jgi:putative peptidoglycan lipid II flippase
MSTDAHREREHFFSAAKAVAALTMLSRVLGLARDMIIIPIGTGALADRFWLAYSIPNLFRRLFGEGALSAAFVPVFSEVSERDGWDRARVVLANVSGLLAMILSTIIILMWAGLYIAWMVWGGDSLRLFLFQMIALVLPFMLTVCMLALGASALQCKGKFRYPAFAPIILNIVLIAGGWIAHRSGVRDDQKFTILALSVVVGGCIQWLGIAMLLKRVGLAMTATTHIRPILAETRRMAILMLPTVLPMAILQLSALADRIIATYFSGAGGPLEPGIVRCHFTANRLFQLPLGVLSISVATVVFPLFSRYAARNDHHALSETVNRALRLSVFLAIPSGVALIVLANPILTLLFQRGGFTAYDVSRSAFMLQMYCLGMWAYFCNQILLRAFFAMQKPRRPAQVACSVVVLNLALVIWGIHTPLKGGAIGLATAITASVTTIILVVILRRTWGAIGLRELLNSLLRTGIATAVMAACILVAIHWVDSPLYRTVVGTVVGLASYYVVVRLLGSAELRELLGRRSKDTR